MLVHSFGSNTSRETANPLPLSLDEVCGRRAAQRMAKYRTHRPTHRLFPSDLPVLEWTEFQADGFPQPGSGIISRSDSELAGGMPVYGIDTDCVDLEYEMDGPVGIGMRTWAPIVPGGVSASNAPGAVPRNCRRHRWASFGDVRLAISRSRRHR